MLLCAVQGVLAILAKSGEAIPYAIVASAAFALYAPACSPMHMPAKHVSQMLWFGKCLGLTFQALHQFETPIRFAYDHIS